MKIAVTMPGKIGDLLYSLPTARHISRIFEQKIDFWTSLHCSPIVSFLKQQKYINDAFVSTKYVAEHDQCGIQPYTLNPELSYDRVFHLGFREYPKCRLVDYFPSIYGFEIVDTSISYDIIKSGEQSDVLVCPGRNSSLKPTFYSIIKELSKTKKVIQIGPKSELINLTLPNVKNIECDFMGAAELISNTKVFIGTLSANLVLANGFYAKKIILLEQERHNAVHDIQSDSHHYLKYNDIEGILRCVN